MCTLRPRAAYLHEDEPTDHLPTSRGLAARHLSAPARAAPRLAAARQPGRVVTSLAERVGAYLRHHILDEDADAFGTNSARRGPLACCSAPIRPQPRLD